ncbi:exportin-5 [Aplysia californica]|uniref:Exportin-5 n=1 Tax=Aplysia californica TaxID=6500 RepID=A0ABM0JQM1_APLCA|nr:exportin-5 [Aplysia californica]
MASPAGPGAAGGAAAAAAAPVPEATAAALRTVVSALECIMDLSATNEQRQAAHTVCEDFKENCPDCIECGLQLARKEYSAVVRHFGLQSVEHWIKYRWHEVNDTKRTALKRSALNLIYEGTNDILVEEQHIKDAVSRILVELIKREWPQLWENLFADFTQLCENGETQTELVLQVLLRLSEDIVRFQTVPQPRRKDLQQALTKAMSSIFSFFLYTLNGSLEKYRAKTDEEREKACRICRAILETLTGFVEWVPITHITDSGLLPLICSLLLDEKLCLAASECLLLIVGRKGRVSDRQPLMVLFSQEAMTVLLQAASNATEHITESSNFIFLKRLCEILLEIGKQLCTLWGSQHTEEQGQPPNFQMYLKALMAFTQHPSQSLRQMVYSMWHIFLRHELASKDPLFTEIMPTLIQCGTVCLHKVGFPSQQNSVSCEYSRMEFDTDEEFNVVLCNLRMSVVDSIRMMTLMVPKMTFSVASSWLKELLAKPIVVGTGADSDKGICNLSSPSFIAWDACSVFLEAVMSKVFLADAEMPKVEEGIDLLHSVLSYEMQDPLILSAVLSCISGLFPFLTFTPQTLPRVLARIFDAVVFNLPGQTKSTRSQAVKNVRVHACSILVKICKNYPELLLPEFQHLYNSVKQLDRDPEQLSQMEKIILIEALIIVSNQFHNFSRQSAFIEEVLQPVKQLWSSEEFIRAFSSPECFMSYVGLDQAAVEPSSADTCGINRSHITYCINTILAVIKRSKWPEDYTVAERGGFVVQGENGNFLRNPATPHVCPLLDNVIALLKTGCCLFKPESLKLRHPDFLKAYDLMEHDRLNILGIPPACVDNSDSLVYRHPLERMQNFITALFEHSFHILGNASSCLGVEIYSAPGLSKVIIENLIANYTLLHDYRARILIRNFLKLFIQHCPKEHHHDVAVPILRILCPETYQRLMGRWQVLNKRAEERAENDEEEDIDTQEVLEDHLVRHLTREYLDFLNLVLFGKNVSSEVKEEMPMDDGDLPNKGGANTTTSFKDLSDLGTVVMGLQDLYPSVIMCILTGFSWADTNVCHKCSLMLWPVCRQLVNQKEISPEAAQHCFMSVLSGLQLHGQHDACYSTLLHLAMTFYETLRKDFPVMTAVLQQIPGVDSKLIYELDEKILPKPGNDRKKKEIFKKIVANIVGKNIGQQFRRAAQYSNLPRLFLESRRPKQESLDEVEKDDMGLCELFSPSKVFD